jgi:inhibitor of KinA
MARERGMQVERLGDTALLVVVGEDAGDATARRVRALAHTLRARRLPGVTDIVPSYRTVAVHYDRAILGPDACEAVRAWIDAGARAEGPKVSVQRREVEVPVCYATEFAPDLAEVAAHCGLSAEEVVRLHSGGRYEVRAVGFMPGFAYLAGLSEQIATPRRATPRTRVPGGSVGIAGMQTGVYPLESPGGWQLIGRTPLRMFQPNAKRVSLLEVGDVVRFIAVTAGEFAALSKEGGA